MKKWQIEIAERVKHYSNRDLLDETLAAGEGDDYDGCFTDQGQWEYEYLILELEKRLGDWLNE